MQECKPTEILYVSYDGMTDPLGQSQVIPYLVRLAKKGFNITLLSCEKRQPFEQDAQKITNQLSFFGIDWQPVFYTKNPPIVSTLLDIWKMKRMARILHRKKNFSIVHCRSYIAAFVGLTLQKKGAKWIFDMRGFYADERVDGHIWNLNNPLYKTVYHFFKKMEHRFLLKANQVISLTVAGKNEILGWNIPSLNTTNITVIPCCADLDLFNFTTISDEKRTYWQKKLSINSHHYVLSYLGSMGTWYMPSEMLDFFNVLKRKMPHALFLFITKDDPEKILKLAASKGIPAENIRIQAATRDQVSELLSICQASLFFIKPVWSKKASSPTKLAEIMGLGLPVITNSGVGDVDWVINQTPSGILIHDFTRQEYEKAVDNLMVLNKTEPEKIRKLACDFFSLEKGVSLYESVYRSLC